MKLPFRHRRRVLAFTLVELLVVLGIISILASLAYPGYTQYLLKAKSLKCANNLRSIGIAVNLAATDNNNIYPEINQTAPPLPYDSSVPGLVGVLRPLRDHHQFHPVPRRYEFRPDEWLSKIWFQL